MSLFKYLKHLLSDSSDAISGYITVNELVAILMTNSHSFTTESLRAFACSLQLKSEQVLYLEQMNGTITHPEAMLKSTLQAWKSTKGRNARMGTIKYALRKLKLVNLTKQCERYKDNDEVIFDRSDGKLLKGTWKHVQNDKRFSTNGRIEEIQDFDNGFHSQCLPIVIGNIQENPFVCDLTAVIKMVNYYCNHNVVVASVKRVGRLEKDADGILKPRLIAAVIEPNYDSRVQSSIELLASALIEGMQSDTKFKEHGFTVELDIRGTGREEMLDNGLAIQIT